MNNQQNAIDTAAAALGSKATYTGAGAATLGWLASSEVSVVLGLAIAILGLLTNLVFQLRRDRREVREHQRRMDHMRTDRGALDDFSDAGTTPHGRSTS